MARFAALIEHGVTWVQRTRQPGAIARQMQTAKVLTPILSSRATERNHETESQQRDKHPPGPASFVHAEFMQGKTWPIDDSRATVGRGIQLESKSEVETFVRLDDVQRVRADLHCIANEQLGVAPDRSVDDGLRGALACEKHSPARTKDARVFERDTRVLEMQRAIRCAPERDRVCIDDAIARLDGAAGSAGEKADQCAHGITSTRTRSRCER